MPDDRHLEKVSTVLADALNLKGQEREKFVTAMKDAVERTRQAIEARKSVHPAEISWFGKMLRKSLEKAAMTEQALADSANAIGAPEQYDFDYVYRIEHGLERPDKAFKAVAEKIISGELTAADLKKSDSNVLKYLADTLGREWLKEINGFGRTSQREIDRALGHGDFTHLSARTENRLKRADELLKQKGILDGQGAFIAGPYEGQKYSVLVDELLIAFPARVAQL